MIQDDLGCYGYYGFGGGWVKGNTRADEKSPLYCASCPEKKPCWEEHRRRATEMMPDLMDAVRKIGLAGHVHGKALVSEFQRQYHCLPPDVGIMAGNIEDGTAVGAGGQPKDRGPYTLAWPLVPRRTAAPR